MRKSFFRALLAAMWFVGLLPLAPAEEPKGEWSAASSSFLTCPETLLKGCFDPYCSKPLPRIDCLRRGCGQDDYCGKPGPCIPCLRGCCPGCYGRKPCPDLCRPLSAQYYHCTGACDPCDVFHPCDNLGLRGEGE